jgi:hypothetical protein
MWLPSKATRTGSVPTVTVSIALGRAVSLISLTVLLNSFETQM